MLTRTTGANPRRRREAAAGTIDLLEKRIGFLEVKEELTKSDKQSILRTSKLLADLSNDFKSYHAAIVDRLESDAEAIAEQAVLDQHQTKVMDLVDRIADLIEEPPSDRTETEKDSSKPSPVTSKEMVVDRQMDILDGAITSVRRDIASPETLDVHVL